MPDKPAVARRFFPPRVTLEMSYSCTHRCVFCSCPWYAPAAPRNRRYETGPEMGAAEYRRLVDLMVDEWGVSSITFSGGEPLLSPALRETAGYAAQKRVAREGSASAPPALSVVTNGSLLDSSWLDFFASVKASVAISLPGLSTYALHTGSPGADFRHALRMIGEAKKRSIQTTASVTVTRANFAEIYETFAEALLAGADYLLVNRFMPGGRGLANIRELLLDSEMTASMLATAEDVLKTAGRNGGVGTEIPLCLFRGMRFERLAARSACAGAVDFFAIDPSGFIRVCTHSDIRILHYADCGKIADNATWKLFSGRGYLPDECAGCSDKLSCSGGCRAAASIAGGFERPVDPVFQFFGRPPDGPSAGERNAR